MRACRELCADGSQRKGQHRHRAVCRARAEFPPTRLAPLDGQSSSRSFSSASACRPSVSSESGYATRRGSDGRGDGGLCCLLRRETAASGCSQLRPCCLIRCGRRCVAWRDERRERLRSFESSSRSGDDDGSRKEKDPPRRRKDKKSRGRAKRPADPDNRRAGGATSAASDRRRAACCLLAVAHRLGSDCHQPLKTSLGRCLLPTALGQASEPVQRGERFGRRRRG